MLKFKKNDQTNFFEFLRPPKNAHLHMVGNVIVKFEYVLTVSFRVFAPTNVFGVDLWRPF